ncbi:hypothetical protein PoB_001685200 [Plakobranchus ocellatus]|uniref:Uncharacterized protein n=1 Tax=Plakobranchus ocellatus TaxID=259542 RepID=A0AAV3Z519_9GAST|nr:hypothetical protein PoB_001685200 [Plakobranchus ocellatus]
MEADNSHSLTGRALKCQIINFPNDNNDVTKSPWNIFSPGPHNTVRPDKIVGDPTVTQVRCFKYTSDGNGEMKPFQYKLKFEDCHEHQK